MDLFKSLNFLPKVFSGIAFQILFKGFLVLDTVGRKVARPTFLIKLLKGNPAYP